MPSNVKIIPGGIKHKAGCRVMIKDNAPVESCSRQMNPR